MLLLSSMTSSPSISDNEVASNRSGLEEDVDVGGQVTEHITDLKSTDVLLGKDPNDFYVDRALPALTSDSRCALLFVSFLRPRSRAQ